MQLVAAPAPDTVRELPGHADGEEQAPDTTQMQPSGEVLLGSGVASRSGSDPDEPLMLRPGDQVGELVVERLLGRGGIGEVYVARHELLRSAFALKVLSRPYRARSDVHERLVTEARALAEFRNHPGIVQVHGASTDPRCGPYIVMELLSGATLRDFLRRRGSLGIPRALAVAALIATITHDLHAKGIVHRDLKPENVFVVSRPGEADFRVVILDLGCVKAPYSGGTTDRVNAMGTVRYMSPEQLMGRPVSGVSDQFALGHMLYEMVVGEHAFEGLRRSFGDVGPATEASWQLHAEMHAPPDTVCPVPVWAIISRLLAAEPAARFPSMAAAAATIHAHLGRIVEHRSDEVLRGLAMHPQMLSARTEAASAPIEPPRIHPTGRVELPVDLPPGVTGPRRTAGRAGGLSSNPGPPLPSRRSRCAETGAQSGASCSGMGRFLAATLAARTSLWTTRA